MSAKICIDLCGPDAKDFSIVRGNECYCSNDAPGIDSGPDKDTGTNQCNLLCVGSITEYCGGTGQVSEAAITVYKRVVSLLTLPAPAYPTNWIFESCFYIDAWVALLTNGTAGNSFTAPAGNTDGVACSNLCFATKSTYTTAVVSDQTCYCSTLSITATASLTANLAGLGECSKPCTNNPGESCGGTSKANLALGIAYTRRPTAPSTTPPKYGTISPSGFFNWGCYFGAVYLLDTILTGLQISSLLDLVPDMDGSKCVNLCKAQSHNYAITIGGVCFCNKKPPTQDLRIVNQVLCNNPCPNHATERCGGEGIFGPKGRSLINIFGADEPPNADTVSEISLLALSLVCLNALCSAFRNPLVSRFGRKGECVARPTGWKW
ncbi:hypothetical protein BDU57DRAFT_551542, partial [Ampelomyces quisqualis]